MWKPPGLEVDLQSWTLLVSKDRKQLIHRKYIFSQNWSCVKTFASVIGREKNLYIVYINVNWCKKDGLYLLYADLHSDQSGVFFQDGCCHPNHSYWFLHDKIRIINNLNLTQIVEKWWVSFDRISLPFIITNSDTPIYLDPIKNHCVTVTLAWEGITFQIKLCF